MYVYCVVCYRVIAAPYVRSVGHVFAYLYTLDDDSECPMDYETSLLLSVSFPGKITVNMYKLAVCTCSIVWTFVCYFTFGVFVT